MVYVLSAVLVVVCVGAFLVLYARRTKVPGGWTREDRRRAMSEHTPESLEAEFQRRRQGKGHPERSG